MTFIAICAIMVVWNDENHSDTTVFEVEEPEFGNFTLKKSRNKKLHLNILKNLNKGCLSIFLGGKKMKDFKIIFAQIILLLGLTLIGAGIISSFGVRSAGKASINYNSEGEVIEVTEKDYYAYAQLNFPVSWAIAAPTLWLEHDNWRPELAYRRATLRTLTILGIICAMIAAWMIWYEFHQLKKSRTDAADEEAEELRARLPFNGWTMSYMLMFGIVSYAVTVGWGIVVLVPFMIICEAIRSILYARRGRVKKRWRLVHEVKPAEDSKTKKVRRVDDVDEPTLPLSRPVRTGRGPIYPVRPRS